MTRLDRMRKTLNKMFLVTLDAWDGMWHVWQDHPDMPEAEQASLEIGQFLLSHLNR